MKDQDNDATLHGPAHSPHNYEKEGNWDMLHDFLEVASEEERRRVMEGIGKLVCLVGSKEPARVDHMLTHCDERRARREYWHHELRVEGEAP